MVNIKALVNRKMPEYKFKFEKPRKVQKECKKVLKGMKPEVINEDYFQDPINDKLSKKEKDLEKQYNDHLHDDQIYVKKLNRAKKELENEHKTLMEEKARLQTLIDLHESGLMK